MAEAPGSPLVKDTACRLRFLFICVGYTSSLSSRYRSQHQSRATAGSSDPHGGF